MRLPAGAWPFRHRDRARLTIPHIFKAASQARQPTTFWASSSIPRARISHPGGTLALDSKLPGAVLLSNHRFHRFHRSGGSICRDERTHAIIAQQLKCTASLAQSSLGKNDDSQILNALKCSQLKGGLLINFGEYSLKWRRWSIDPTH